MDFIEQLPLSDGFTDILVMVDRLTKQAVFVPTTRTINASTLAELFIQHVFAKHGAPSHITSDHGMEFVSKFFKSLAHRLEMKLHFTSGYHPEADGQTKHTNQTLEQFLGIYCNYQQSDWARLLPLAEFTYNSTPSATTELSPFFANKGYYPKSQIIVEQSPNLAAANEYLQGLADIQAELKLTILEAQRCYQSPMDKRHSPAPKICIGDLIFILARFIRMTQSLRKLVERFLGPFKVAGQPGMHSYLMKLPTHLRFVHPVFYVSQLEPAFSSQIPNRESTPLPPVVVNENLEFELQKVLDSK